MKISDTGIQLIKSHEGLRLDAYLCPADVWTIGYGHTNGVAEGMTITDDGAELLLRMDVGVAEAAVNKHTKELNQNQFDSLVSFTFNVGVANFRKSTLLKKVNKNPAGRSIADEFARWKYAKGKVLAGLVRRRKDEAELYFF